jgi:hypothetical protein
MNLNIMPKLYITNNFLYLNKMLDHKNDDPQQLNIVIKNPMFHKWMLFLIFVELEL